MDFQRYIENVGVEIVNIENGNEVSTILRRLPDDYPVHMAELWALGMAVGSLSGVKGRVINLVTDSRVALDMVTRRKGETADAILRDLQRIEDESAKVKL
ncbi:hypothetical protein Zmor_015322 [Zophobas morio]|uniref:Uncharacterized protein n=1 Tax=Zophobas morio TaxID=2755281 RepID=A0AA38MHN4_9CUCU|nr:hypothetical protein Zmor_015322 [Zophobas morio]